MSKHLRLGAYIRVSRVGGREGDSFISPDQQREKIAAYARLHDHTIVREEIDLDQSGKRLVRPGLDALLAAIEAREIDGIAVARLDRLSRAGVADALRLIERIQQIGGAVISADFGIDPTTEVGEMVLTVLLALARMEWRRLDASWRDAKTRAVDRGAKLGPTPIGYRRREDGTLKSDPKMAPIVQEAFTRAARSGIHAATDYLMEALPDRRWTMTTVRRRLTNRVYLGEVRYEGRADGEPRLVKLDAHEALVSRAVWEHAQPPATIERRASGDFPLSGVASCASCGGHMVGARGGKGQRTYRCAAGLSTSRAACDAPAVVTADLLEEYVLGRVQGLFPDAPAIEAVERDGSPGAPAAMLEELRASEAELESVLADVALRRTLGVDRFQVYVEALVADVDAKQEAYREALAATAQTWRVSPAHGLADLPSARQGDVYRNLGLVVEVSRGRVPIAEKVRVALDYSDE